MISNYSSKYVVLGGGFTGLIAIKTLFEEGVDPKDLVLVDFSQNLVRDLYVKEREIDIFTASDYERANSGLGKLGKDVLTIDLKINNIAPGKNWGLSCYPCADSVLLDWKVDLKTFQQSWEQIIDFLDIENTHNAQKFSGNESFIPRKEVAKKWIGRNEKFHHSILALKGGESGCSLQGGCFEGCSVDAPTAPHKLKSKLENQFGPIKFIDSRAVNLNHDNTLTLLNGEKLKYQKLILTAGTLDTMRILQDYLNDRIIFDYSPVTLIPFISYYKTTTKDYYSHFSYCDLVFPIFNNKAIEHFIQVYAPSRNITVRVLANLPSFFVNFLKFIGNKLTVSFFKHVGIAMIFDKEHSFLESIKTDRHKFRQLKKEIRIEFQKSLILPIFIAKKKLEPGASHHYGGIRYIHENYAGFRSKLWNDLANKNIYILDTSALPSLQPGPITATAVALANYLVRTEVLK